MAFASIAPAGCGPSSLSPPAGLGRLLTELRIDVDLQHPSKPLSDELEALHQRLRTPGDRLFGLPEVPLGGSEFVLRHRQADGEYYVYVEDVRQRRLAGYTVFNRLIELDRRADRCLRAPHSRYDAPYQRRGLASAVYGWGLEAGLCLVTGARQSPGAHALWRSLARRHVWGYAAVRDKTLTWLGTEVPPAVLDELATRMLLLGRGWSLAGFAAAAGLRGVADEDAAA